ncbi:preprotein translocase subunit SecE [Ruminococcus sp.]|uniref:preprotein translocase subunit SecE n=1 Tax=Ruminococcus sp. TaxID=41978 RepID=UPI0025DE804E|nr:preprotein translocase subunit SecE [Ruminococcus sp.]MCI5815796.1 preprotein translocase subunit SecE [Ruminococcus sp.]MDD7556819.1 preprotein translocase subunit SecE [Ruminococcus sp.]MDY4964090.1 preprotein translocase subunit SecE [Ruminococcus callidus]
MAKEEKSKKASGDGWFKRFFKGIAKWFRDLKSEFKKVSWPSRKTVFDNTVVVLVTMLLTALFVGGLDAGLLKLFELALHG